MVEKRGKEDYIHIVYELDGENGEGVRSIDISRRLGVSKASVSEMLRKLAKEGLVKIKPYSNIFLTQKGKKIAEISFDKHQIVKEFLKKMLNYDDNKAYKEAHNLKNAFSEESIKILEKFITGKSINELPSYCG